MPLCVTFFFAVTCLHQIGGQSNYSRIFCCIPGNHNIFFRYHLMLLSVADLFAVARKGSKLASLSLLQTCYVTLM